MYLMMGSQLRTRRQLKLVFVHSRDAPALVVDEVSVARGVDDVQAQLDAVLLDDCNVLSARGLAASAAVLTMRDRLDLCRLADGLIRLDAPLGLDQMRRKQGVDQRRLAQAGLAWQQHDRGQHSCTRGARRPERAPTTMTLNWKPRLRSFCSIWRVMLSKPTLQTRREVGQLDVTRRCTARS